MENANNILKEFHDAKQRMLTRTEVARQMANEARNDFVEEFGAMVAGCTAEEFEALMLSPDVDPVDREYAFGCRMEALLAGHGEAKCKPEPVDDECKCETSGCEDGKYKCYTGPECDDQSRLHIMGIILG